MRQIVVIAGGLATRLYPITLDKPKSMIEIAGKPFIHHQLEIFKKNNIESVVMCVGYLSEQIVDYVKDGKDFDLEVVYS